MMKRNKQIIKFTTKIILFILPYISFGLITFPNEIIKLSNSESFNIKLCELHNLNTKHYDIISLGSSMTLNNLNSETFVMGLKNKSYHNFSSWGLRINNQLNFLKIINELYSPSTIITVCNVGDFTNGYITTEDNAIKLYLKGFPSFILRPIYYGSFSYNKSCQEHKKAVGKYNYLGYDEYGGVNIDVKKENIDSSRWNEISTFIYDNSQKQYSQLEEICKYLHNQKIKYILVQSPSRKHYIQNREEQLKLHIEKIKNIASKYDQIFIETKKYYDDSLFNDCTHLNIKGSTILTEEIINTIKNEKIL